MSGADFAAQHHSTQGTQQHSSKQSTATRVVEGRENRENCEEEYEIRKEMKKKEVKGKGERPDGEEESEIRRVEEAEDKEVDEYPTDWVEVRRRTRGKSYKMAQIFVKVNGTFQGSLSSRGLLERSTGTSQAHEDSSGFKFSMTCHKCSNPFVRDSHSVHVLQAFSFGIQASPKKRVKGRSQ